MKKQKMMIYSGLVLLFLTGHLCVEAASDLIFTEPNGTRKAWEIDSYKPSIGVVKLKSGTEYRSRPFSKFSKSDQQRIKTWLADKSFKSSSGLRIRAEKNEVEREYRSHEITYTEKGSITKVSYVITLENRSSVALKNVKTVYRIFYKTQRGNQKEKRCVIKTKVFDIAAGQIRTVETETVEVRDLTNQSPPIWNGGEWIGGAATTRQKDKLRGMHLSVIREDLNGKIQKREYKKGHPPRRKDWVDYR